MEIYKDFSVVLSCCNYKYHQITQMSRICTKPLISAKFSWYKLFLHLLLGLYYLSFLRKGTTSGYGEPSERHSSAEECPSRNTCLVTFPWRVNWPELEVPTKNKGFIQLTFPEKPEAIAAIKLVLGLLVPDQNHHSHCSRYSLKLKFVSKTLTGYLHTSSLPTRSATSPASIQARRNYHLTGFLANSKEFELQAPAWTRLDDLIALWCYKSMLLMKQPEHCKCSPTQRPYAPRLKLICYHSHCPPLIRFASTKQERTRLLPHTC